MKQHFSLSFLFLFLIFFVCKSHAQPYLLADSISFIQNGKTLRSPYAGGINLPRYSPIDLNGDQIDDLFIFDKDGNVVTTFLNGGTPSQIDYTHAPQYEGKFPAMRGWTLLRDFNCDDQADIFTWNNDGIRVYRNTSSGGNVSFVLETNKLKSTNGSSTADIYVTLGDVPAILDVDGDGDVDILTYDAGGSFLGWYSNQSADLGNCDTLAFVLADACWGKFEESGLSNQITLNVSCKGGTGFDPATQQGTVHSGSTVAAFDEDGDQDKEVLIGDLLSKKLVYLHNGGTSTNAFMDSLHYSFPAYDTPVDFDIFPAPFFMDVNNDGRDDLIVGPNAENVSINADCSWLYTDIGLGPFKEFSLSMRDFIQGDMIDVGWGAYPVFFDYNADGLLDLVLGNISLKTINQNFSGLTVYENTGTATHPEFTLVSRNFQNLAQAFSPAIYGAFPAFGDLDGDGDDDLVLGDSDGFVHLLKNSAGAGNPAVFSLTSYKFSAIDIGQFAAPVILDLDNDGLKDLIVGEMDGTLNFFKNTGSTTNPTFSSTPTQTKLGNIDISPACCTGFMAPFFYQDTTGNLKFLCGSEDGGIFHFGNITGNVTGSWTQLDTNFHDFGRGSRSAITGADLDGDGQMEFAVTDMRGGLRLYTIDKINSRPAPRPEFGWTVYPNPSTHPRIHLEAPAQGLVITCFDLQGKLICAQPIPAGGQNFEMQLPEMRQGIYFLQLRGERGVLSVRKWVKN
ncbi:MAG: T9SS type A sorting domain-containing protein [Bacteroidia bacterium]|nr:T9SS type A sorting domain-containing protein [Bacteroidia bacterium]